MKGKAHVLVCVTQQSSCERLIEAGASIAKSHDMQLSVINVQPEKDSYSPDPQAMEHLYGVCKKFGAEMNVYFSDAPAVVTAVHAKKNNAKIVTVGFPGEKSSRFIAEIRMLLPETVITMVDSDKKIYNMIPEANKSLTGVRV